MEEAARRRDARARRACSDRCCVAATCLVFVAQLAVLALIVNQWFQAPPSVVADGWTTTAIFALGLSMLVMLMLFARTCADAEARARQDAVDAAADVPATTLRPHEEEEAAMAQATAVSWEAWRLSQPLLLVPHDGDDPSPSPLSPTQKAARGARAVPVPLLGVAPGAIL